MKTMIKMLFTLALISLISCDVDQTQEGEMPDVDVNVEEGEMPEYDVDWADVDVNTTTRTIEVPKVVVVMEEEQVEVPVVDVDMPNEEKEERTIMVEAQVAETSHEIEIEGIYASKNRLIVVSELESTGQDLQKQTMRVSDQIVLNAPDLDVKHYIIGEKPRGDFNNQYTYISSKSEIADKLSKATEIL
ncbi:hypothetical protein [Phaeodactylibacter xiamenensis]|jgi:hypothetical protein|uniref:hypothetical protein n=1 Tax=Phaeodactylibacter xiamenensis TaxID=1524460 RepID=UPI0024A9E994|nr:hypothetical protein [Phaeodactylibacter xiamenensis]